MNTLHPKLNPYELEQTRTIDTGIHSMSYIIHDCLCLWMSKLAHLKGKNTARYTHIVPLLYCAQDSNSNFQHQTCPFINLLPVRTTFALRTCPS